MGGATSSEREGEEMKPQLQSGGDGARDDGRGTRNWAGESGRGGGRYPFKAGQNLVCKVLSKCDEVPGGYFVTATQTGQLGFVQSTEVLSAEEEILAMFVCWAPQKSYILLTPLLAKLKSE